MVLIGYWPLDETSGTTANDVRNGNDGVIDSGIGIGESGVLGDTSFYFYGDGNYVAINDPGVVGTNNRTISAWIKLNDFTDGRNVWYQNGATSGSSSGQRW